MQILITETNEVKSLDINTDPTDSLLANYSANNEFKQIDDSKDVWAGNAEYEMSQADYNWWKETVDSYNKADELEADLTAQGKLFVAGVLNEYFTDNDIGDSGDGRIAVLSGYYGEDEDLVNRYHELSNIEFINNESGIAKYDDGSYDFTISVTVSGVLLPKLNVSKYALSEESAVVLLNAYLDSDGNFDFNGDFPNLYSKYDIGGEYATYADGLIDHDVLSRYVQDIAFKSHTSDGLTLMQACEKLVKSEIK